MPAFELHRNEFPGIAASAINPGQVVKLDVGDVARQVVPVATRGDQPFGVALATAAQGAPVTVEELGSVIKVVAGGSVGHGADVTVASTNGSLAPASGVASYGIVPVFSVGVAVTAAAAGETFSLYVRPRLIQIPS